MNVNMCRANGRSRAVFVGRPRKREGKTEQMSLYLNIDINMCWANRRSSAVFVGWPKKREGKTEQMFIYLNMCWANRRPISGIKHYIEGVCAESYIDIVLEFNTI